MPAGSGYPTHYKVDVAFPKKKLAVELDGASHNTIARQEQDAKKTNFLASLGWTVLRYANKRVILTPQIVKAELRSIISRLPDIQATP
jgi:very-short-patch-repair endonuclease